MGGTQQSQQIASDFPVSFNEKRLWGGFAILVFIFAIVAAVLLLNRYQSRLLLAQERLNNLAQLYHDNIQLQLSSIESLTRATAAEFEQDLSQAERQEFVTAIARGLPQLRTLLLMDAEGTTIADSRPDAPALGINIKDRTYFVVHQNRPSDSLFIDKPVQSRVDGNWSLPISLGVWDKDGEFMGVVVASLDPIFFSQALASITQNDIIGYVLDQDNIILTALPYDTDMIGQPFTLSLLSDEQSVRANANPTYLIASKAISNYDYRLVFAQSRTTILQSYALEVRLIVLLFIGLVTITYLILRYQIKQLREIKYQSYLRQERERDYRTLTENMSDFIVRFDRDLHHLYVNPALLEATGLSLEDYIGKTNRELGMPIEQVDFWDREISKVFASGQPNEMAFKHITTRGERHYQAKLTPERDKDGHVQSVLSVVRDVTDFIETQSILIERTRSLQLSLQAAGAGMWIWDFATGRLQWDEAMLEMYGISSDEFQGVYEDWKSHVHPDDVERAEALVAISIQKLQPYRDEFRIIRPDGTLRHLMGQAVIIQDEALGVPVRFIGVNIDITDRIEAEKQRLETERIHLEIQQQRQVVELKERFIATASHDFRTPLTVIRTSATMLEDYFDRLNEQQRLTRLHNIQEQVTRMMTLLDEVLKVSKAQSGGVVPTPEPIHLRSFCQRLWEDILILDNGQHQTEFQYKTTLEHLTADPHLLRQALSNLLSNALKYTPEGKRITFTVRSEEDKAIFTVADEGYGIPPEDQEHLYKPFHRARNVMAITGTGLGLTIVKDYIELHNGHIDYTSKVDSGTIFTVKIPQFEAG